MNRGRRRHVMWLVALGGALALSGLLVLMGLSVGRTRCDAAPDVAAVDAILAQPRCYWSRDVTVRGEVVRLWGNGMVSLRSHPLRQGLLVVTKGAKIQNGGLHKGQVVEVTGHILPFRRQEVLGLRQLGAELRDDILRAIGGRDPYLVAEEVRLADAPR